MTRSRAGGRVMDMDSSWPQDIPAGAAWTGQQHARGRTQRLVDQWTPAEELRIALKPSQGCALCVCV